MSHIIIFGSSNDYGYGDHEGGWVQRLRKLMDKKTLLDGEYYYLLYNLAVSGDTSDNLLERFEDETRRRVYDIEDPDKTIVILCIGKNDICWSKEKNDFSVPIEKFGGNVRDLISLSKKYSNHPVIIGPGVVDDSLCNPWKTFDYYLKNENLERYNNKLQQICLEEKINFIEIFSVFKEKDYKKLLMDGLHLNNQGHELLFKIVKNYLEKNKIVEL
ncbi:MAG: GDSL-type esterase/lipase family protein [Patescibacteria group bacterium]